MASTAGIYDDASFGNMDFFGSTVAPAAPAVTAAASVPRPHPSAFYTVASKAPRLPVGGGLTAMVGGVRGVVFACILAAVAVAVLVIAHQARQTRLRTQGFKTAEISRVSDPRRRAVLEEWSYLHGVATLPDVRQALVRVLESELSGDAGAPPTTVPPTTVPPSTVPPASPLPDANDPYFTPG